MSRLRLLPPTALSGISPIRDAPLAGTVVPLLLTPEAERAYRVQSSWLAMGGRDFRGLLFGRREPHALVVQALVSDDLPPAERAAFLALIQEQRLVLLGQAHDFSERCLPRVALPTPYAYLVTYTIDHQAITACHSVAGNRITNHPVAILQPSQEG